MRILLIEDAPSLGEAVHDQITEDGHAVDWMQTLAEGEACLATTDYDLLLLDLLLPDGNGLDLLRQRRRAGVATPIIILTARDQISDRIAGLNAGADDYLVKPFDLEELSARVAAVARRYTGNPNPLIHVGELEIDLVNHSVHRAGQDVELTAREWALLEALVQHPGALLSRSQLEDRLYAFGAEIESNTIEVHISRMRKKLGHASIETVRGMGYRLGRS
ncbi:DNA-binding response regulator, OmpR family, contains REC and winged-helix (wHTH) domain [Modicisalibacter ilicicola DSM 19980]|uniref:DNA-binding response regulator, OmpR family, contains REC and winged-helix (WHTH) domain n=1 Tax=Modicisalibacter ilicicola DSM 19980 TaxID=1121942 RepID=A0A1M4SH31_9GAMM|nr:response regulator transcription factor [Halomonas ilicicola]SHE31533.1 DNA-binding response regulator, OmpR family, contains REC and winged-helix (wHTH) domain [Halomonas ilicicola DSM 19980]